MKRTILSLFFLLILSSYVSADPTFFGPTGLIEMPTAKAIEYKKIGGAIDYRFDQEDQDGGQTYYKFNLGTYENLELGIVGGEVPTEGVFVNGKYFIMSDSEAYPTSLAIGMQNIGSQYNSNLYLVASKIFEGGLEGHFGFKATFDRELDTSAMLGIEYFFTDKISILTDYTGENRKYTLNVGSRFYFNESFTYRISALDLNQTKKRKETLLIMGLSFAKFL